MTKPFDSREEQATVVHEVPTKLVPRRGKKPFVLEQTGGFGAPREFVLELDEIVVGRSLQASISIESGAISRQHFVLKKKGAEYAFTDLKSSNGVYLNSVKTHSAVLREGDLIQIGDVTFVFHEGA